MSLKTTPPYDTWSPWYSFSQLFEYRGLIDETGETKRKIEVEWKGSVGFLHRDNGFRLRSFDYRYGSFSNMDLYTPLEGLPCPLRKGDLGVYWLRIKINQVQYNYIGLSGSRETSIYKRLIDHFTKIAGTFEYSSGYKDTDNFKSFREDMKKIGIDNDSDVFFKENVEISFVKIKESKEVNVKVAKIEGMAIQAFKDKFGVFPELNSRDETIGLDGMPLEE